MQHATVAVLHAADDRQWAEEVAIWVEAMAQGAMEEPGTVEVVIGPDAIAAAGAAAEVSAVLYLVDGSGAPDGDKEAAAEAALDADLAVFPVFDRNRGDVGEALPPALALLNAAEWTDDRLSLGVVLLATCGLAEEERRLFLSYRRADTGPMAEQLHTALSRAGFDVFLDRFSIPPGDDFQQRLTEELADKAFVLVLESPQFVGREWTDYEIAYAESHGLGLVAVTPSDLAPEQLVPTIADAFRLRLDASDVANGRLTEAALDRILQRVERDHARALRRRREQLLGSLRAKLLSDGCDAGAAGPWALFASKAGHNSGVFLVTPRRPRPRDLLDLDRTKERILASVPDPVDASVVHGVEDVPEAVTELLAWIGEPRAFQAVLWQTCALRPEGR